MSPSRKIRQGAGMKDVPFVQQGYVFPPLSEILRMFLPGWGALRGPLRLTRLPSTESHKST
jgi:hypothetical protein